MIKPAIRTVSGEIPAEQLGQTLMHEHVIATSITMQHVFGDGWLPEDLIVQRAVTRFKLAKEAGIDSIVDCTPLNLGRDVRLLAKVANLTGVNILAATGMFHVTDFAFLRLPAQTLAAYFIDECRNGIQDTGIRPAVIKAAVEYEVLSDCDKKYLEVAALIQQATGLPIYLHTQAKFTNGIAAVHFLLEHGAMPDRLIVGHVLDTLDIDYPLHLLDMGVNICCDRIFSSTSDFQDKLELIADLLQRGFAERITLAHDHICCENKWNRRQTDELRPATVHDSILALTVIPQMVIPYLQSQGLPQQVIQQIMVTNPQKLLIVNR